MPIGDRLIHITMDLVKELNSAEARCDKIQHKLEFTINLLELSKKELKSKKIEFNNLKKLNRKKGLILMMILIKHLLYM